MGKSAKATRMVGLQAQKQIGKGKPTKADKQQSRADGGVQKKKKSVAKKFLGSWIASPAPGKGGGKGGKGGK